MHCLSYELSTVFDKNAKKNPVGIAVSFQTLTTDLDLEDTYFVYRIRKIVLKVNGKCTIDVS